MRGLGGGQRKKRVSLKGLVGTASGELRLYGLALPFEQSGENLY